MSKSTIWNLSYGYIEEDISLVQRTEHKVAHTWHPDKPSLDENGYLITDDFGTRINLMMECGMLHSGGRLVIGDFEACIKAIRHDLDTKKLDLSF